MKLRSWLKYFVYISIILLIVYAENYGLQYVKSHMTGGFNLHIIMSFLHIVIGVILGLDHLVKEIKKQGVWKINFPKLILIGIPSLYFTLSFYIYGYLSAISLPINTLLGGDTGFMTVFRIVLGHTIITSFYKTDKIFKF
ncbi:hypothetical protein GC105_14465 [Alkalibaculum sp. M08DMB]|uniref:Uncharacterized protein n=1 Tax=Alkalibaculum sporogenes TaxID=2655001 RepID=A0A6A7KCB4_9FIRM|nr:hypothetical protein [Alkalibaculum sporogenes]MPW26985.1 hypothetical protein [Alkalibaculum sporogenes]